MRGGAAASDKSDSLIGKSGSVKTLEWLSERGELIEQQAGSRYAEAIALKLSQGPVQAQLVSTQTFLNDAALAIPKTMQQTLPLIVRQRPGVEAQRHHNEHQNGRAEKRGDQQQAQGLVHGYDSSGGKSRSSRVCAIAKTRKKHILCPAWVRGAS